MGRAFGTDGFTHQRRRRSWRRGLAVALGCGLLWMVPAAEGGLPQVVRTDAGPNPADIQDTVDQFRADLGGVNNGVAGSFTSGRREINWDDVPDANAAPNALNPKFFNTTSPRGAVFNTIEHNASGFSNEFMVSADAIGPTSTPIEFGNIDSSYPATFKPFSSPRLFTARRTNLMEVTFFIPGTQIPATVSGFGAVFTDVDVTAGPRAAKITVYDADGDPLGAFTAPASSGGLSFVGVTYTGRDRIARVTIQTGNAALASGVTDSAATDVIAMDDFIYGEPRAMEEHPGDFDGDGGTDLTVFRPSDGLWFIQDSGSGATHIEAWGTSGDIPSAS